MTVLKEVINVAIGGCLGRMGRILCDLVLQDPQLCLVGCIQYEGHPAIRQPMSDYIKTTHKDRIHGSNLVVAKLSDLDKIPDVLIDFSTPQGTFTFIDDIIKSGHKISIIIGTTGFTDEELNFLCQEVCQKIGVLQASNFSLGVNLMSHLVSQSSRILGEDFDTEMMEIHHNRKVDAPSGTMLTLLEQIQKNATGNTNAVHGRKGLGLRKRDEVGVHSLRMGNVVGEHTVYFCSDFERIEITHKALSKELFAIGAIKAAKWLFNKPPRFYSMQDVLAIQKE